MYARTGTPFGMRSEEGQEDLDLRCPIMKGDVYVLVEKRRKLEGVVVLLDGSDAAANVRAGETRPHVGLVRR